MEDVIIKIGASSKQFSEEMDKIQSKTEDLREHLKTMTEVAGLAFAGFTATVAGCVMKFNEQEQADLKLNAVLRATGGIAGETGESISQIAKALDTTTVYSEDTIRSTETVMLQFTNISSKIFPDATKAILDFAAGTGQDAPSAAFALGRALNDPTAGMMKLQREGVQFTESQKSQIKVLEMSGDVMGAQKIILEAVARAHGGMAEAAAQGGGQIRKLTQQVEEFAEDMGQHFAPIVNAAAGQLAKFIEWVRQHDEVFTFGTAVIGAGVAVSGIVLVGGAATLMFLKFRAALLAAQVAIDLTSLSIRGLVGATGLGLLIVIGTEVALHWESIWPRMQAVFQGFVTTVTQSLQGMGKLLTGVFTLDRAAIEEGLAQLANSMKSGWETATKEVVAVSKEGNRQLADENKAAADAEKARNRAAIEESQRIESERKRFEFASVQAHNAGMLLEYQRASAELVAIKNKEGDLLKTIAEATGVKELASVRAAAQKRLSEVRQLEQEAFALESQRKGAEGNLQLLEQRNDSQALIGLKKKEIEDLKNLQDLGFQGDRALVREHLADTRRLYLAEQSNETQRERQFRALETRNSAAFQRLTLGQQRQFDDQKKRQLLDSLNTEADAQANAYQMMKEAQIKTNNDRLADQVRFGTAYAELNVLMHSEIAEGTSKAFSELAQLTQSHNSVLKAAGQVAASAQIVMKTAQAAMDVYAGFQALPFGLGIPLGIAAAGLVVAYGAEQEANVWSAARGGVMSGGVRGIDSIPTLTMPGELITPTANFEEVIGSVAAQRAAQRLGSNAAVGGGGAVQVKVDIGFQGSASRMLTAQVNQDKALGRYRGSS